jgi:hypothetical protein
MALKVPKAMLEHKVHRVTMETTVHKALKDLLAITEHRVLKVQMEA